MYNMNIYIHFKKMENCISKLRRMYWMYLDVLGCILDVSHIFWMY
jgi:hypothetical protein